MVNENYVSLKEEKFKILQNTSSNSNDKEPEQDELEGVSDVSLNWKERHDKPQLNKNKKTQESYYQKFNKIPLRK